LSRWRPDGRRSGRANGWLGLAPRQRSTPIHTTGGKVELGSVGKTGRTDIRRLPIVGASRRRPASRATSVVRWMVRWVVREGGSPNRWLAALVARKPGMVAAPPMSPGALAFHRRPPANGVARMIGAVTASREDCRMA